MPKNQMDTVPSLLYHATDPDNVESIRFSGITPMRNRTGLDDRKIIWLSSAKYIHKFYHAASGMIILEIDSSQLDLAHLREDNQSYAYTYSLIIPPENIRVYNTDVWGLQESEVSVFHTIKSCWRKLMKKSPNDRHQNEH